LWLTGELRLEKPTVEQELAWGLYFVHEILFEVVPELVDKLERALRQAYPTERWQVAPFFQFGSWIGGDRDGNPFVTNDVTRRALFENRIASLRRYRQRLADLLVRPVRREVEAFRFSTFRLDVRDNPPRVNGALAALWRARNAGDPPSPASPEWRTWLLHELARPLRPTTDRPAPPPEALET